MDLIELRSDNSAAVTPAIIAAVLEANEGSALAYGGDEWTARLREVVREVFEFPDADVFPVVSGTAANALALSAVCPPWGAVLCHETAHILTSEAAATSMFSGGAHLRGLPGLERRLTPEAIEQAYDTTRWGDPHESQPAAISVTNASEYGLVYSPGELTALSTVARRRSLRTHIDGARLANAIAAADATPAEMTWRAGFDLVSLGALKNGALSADAIVTFAPELGEQLTFRLKRAGHVASKMRFQAVQLEAYLTDGRWLRTAAHANAMARRLADGLRALGVELVAEPQANLIFLRLDDALADRIAAAGVLFYGLGSGMARFVTSWATTDAEVDEALARVDVAMGAPASRRS